MRTRRHLLAVAALALAAAAPFAEGCGLGDVGAPSAGSAAPPSGETEPTPDDLDAPSLTNASHCIEPACEKVPLPPSEHALRLTKTQWERTMRDLLQLPAEPGLSSGFPVDPSVGSDHFGTEAGDVVVTTTHAKAFESAAEELAKLVVDDPVALDRILPPAAKAGDVAARVQAFVADFLPKAYRRPVTSAEIAEVIALGEATVQADLAADPFLLRIKWILTSVLQSPHVLYRIELGDSVIKDGRARLAPYEIAEKLAYALWGTTPDATLTEYARSGKLSTRAGVAAVAKEMLASPKANPTLAEFHDQWMFVWDYLTAERRPQNFPRYYTAFTRDIQDDVRLTIKDLVIDKNGGVKDLYTSTLAYTNAQLAPVFDIDPSTVPALVVSPGAFTKVQMDATKRIGVFMHPGWLAYEGSPKDPSIIRRGAYLARHVLCLPLGNPPPAAAGADPGKSSQPTNRKRVEETTKGCGDGCHGGPTGIINPLGFGLEAYDSLGAVRTSDGDQPLDTTGAVEAIGAFDGGVTLFQKVATSPHAHACYAAHWVAYLNGTTKIDAHARWLTPVVDLSLKGGSVRDIIAALVQTDAFLTVSR